MSTPTTNPVPQPAILGSSIQLYSAELTAPQQNATLQHYRDSTIYLPNSAFGSMIHKKKERKKTKQEKVYTFNEFKLNLQGYKIGTGWAARPERTTPHLSRWFGMIYLEVSIATLLQINMIKKKG